MFDTIAYTSRGPAVASGNTNRVFFYGLSFCDHCVEGIAFLDELDIPYAMTYIDKLDPEVRRPVLSAFRRIHGEPVVYPILEVDGELTIGFNREVWKEKLEAVITE